jgi:hypothetical protein
MFGAIVGFCLDVASLLLPRGGQLGRYLTYTGLILVGLGIAVLLWR